MPSFFSSQGSVVSSQGPLRHDKVVTPPQRGGMCYTFLLCKSKTPFRRRRTSFVRRTTSLSATRILHCTAPRCTSALGPCPYIFNFAVTRDAFAFIPRGANKKIHARFYSRVATDYWLLTTDYLSSLYFVGQCGFRSSFDIYNKLVNAHELFNKSDKCLKTCNS